MNQYCGTPLEEKCLHPLPPEIRQYIISLVKDSYRREIGKLIKKVFCGHRISIQLQLIYIDPHYKYKRPPHTENLFDLGTLERFWGFRNRHCLERFLKGRPEWFIEEYLINRCK